MSRRLATAVAQLLAQPDALARQIAGIGVVALVNGQRSRAVQRLHPRGGRLLARVEQRPQPLPALGEMTPDAPEAGHRRAQAQRLAGLVPGVPLEGGADVLVLGLEPVKPGQLVRAAQPSRGRFGQGQERRGVARLNPGPLRHLGQPFGRVLADHEQHPERGSPVASSRRSRLWSTSSSSPSRTSRPKSMAAAQTDSASLRLMPPRNTEQAASRRLAPLPSSS